MLDDNPSSRRTVTAGCLRQISCAIQFLFDFEFLFLRSLLHSGACEGCTKIPLKEPVLRLLKSQTFSRRVWLCHIQLFMVQRLEPARPARRLGPGNGTGKLIH